MSCQQHPPAERGWSGGLLSGWNRFWFTPADPTLLGLIRICCGLVILYVHLSYSYDLQSFFGRHAWMDLQMLNEFRHEAPVLVPATGWEEVSRTAQPQTAAQMEYVRRYRDRFGQDPPAPFPQSLEEEEWINNYRERWSIDPRLVYAKGRPLFSIWYHVTEPLWMTVVHIIFLVAMALFTIGFCTRVTAAVTWLGVLSYIQRSPTTLFGMDTIMIVVVLYLLLSPSGAAFSVDRLLAGWWLRRAARREGRELPVLGPSPPLVSANVALRLMQIHTCIIYFVAGVSKLQGQTWWTGTATWFTMANNEFSPVRFQLYADFLRFLVEHRWLWEVVMTGGTAFTVLFELGFPFLIWQRATRWLMLSCAILLHTGIAIFMGLNTFSFMMLTLILCFVPASTVRQLRARWMAAWPTAVTAGRRELLEESRQTTLVGGRRA